MLLILIAIITAGAIGALLLLYMDSGYGTRHLVGGIAGVVICIVSGVAAISYAFAGWGWIAADIKARIINREYGTQYSREEIFFASDVIDTIREIDRKRVEVNGDLLHEKSDK